MIILVCFFLYFQGIGTCLESKEYFFGNFKLVWETCFQEMFRSICTFCEKKIDFVIFHLQSKKPVINLFLNQIMGSTGKWSRFQQMSYPLYIFLREILWRVIFHLQSLQFKRKCKKMTQKTKSKFGKNFFLSSHFWGVFCTFW